MSFRRVLLKSGGAALENEASIQAVCAAVRELRAQGCEVILVHGGGKAINRELEQRQITWEFIEGQRKTTPEMIEVIESTLCGLVNRKLVRALIGSGVRAAGLSGLDGQTLQCVVADPRLGRVGQVEKVSSELIESILAAGMVPVVAPVGIGAEGEAYNVNADWAASRLASGLQVDALIFLTDQPGVLGARGEVSKELSVASAKSLILKGVVHGGMLAKMRSILDALERGVSEVRVAHANDASAALRAEAGTKVLPSRRRPKLNSVVRAVSEVASHV